jgi:Phosphoglycerate dehydrogenase and related dehydrogenases
MKIILATQFASEVTPHLPPDVEVVYVEKDGRFEGDASDAEVLMIWGTPDVVFDTVLEAAPHLRWMHTPSAGIDHVLTPVVRARPNIIFTNSPGLHAIPIAESVLAFMLSYARKLPELRAAQTERRWIAPDLHELYGQTLLIIGLGGIGQAVATRAAAFGMRVWGSRRTPQPMPGVEEVVGVNAWRDLLPDADYVVIAAPLTPATHGMFDTSALRAMRSSAYLINIARGAIIDEVALLTALQAGWIAGAALDAFSLEPLPPDSPFWTLPNVVVTPHCTWSSPRMRERAAKLFLDNLARYRQGAALRHVVYP